VNRTALPDNTAATWPTSLPPTNTLRCPRCRSTLTVPDVRSPDRAIRCTDVGCALSRDGFPEIDGVPALVDFENSVLSREHMLAARGRSYKERRVGPLRRLQKALTRGEGPTARNAERFLAELKQLDPRPVVLVIGGGAIGVGAEALYHDPDICLIGSDIYVSQHTAVIADGHQLPLADGSVHGVWIQAVLEHVLDPQVCVDEIHRVLKPDGLVYAETPFMQQVHEGAYDFTRFTLSGHRWLFRGFSEIDGGVTRGPGVVLLWSIRYFASAIFGNRRAGSIATLAFFWLRFFDRVGSREHSADGPSGVFFLGRRAASPISRRDIVSYYKGAQR
jgi:SAM-dependent methyltransferase